MMIFNRPSAAAAVLVVLCSGVLGVAGICLGQEVPAEAPAAVQDVDSDAGMPPLLQFDIGSAVVNIAIFIGVITILAKFVWPVILQGLEARETKIRGDLESAHAANLQARELLASYDTKISEASTQVQKMLADAQKASEAERQRMIADAKVEAETHRQRALADIEQAKKVAISELAGQTSEMALAVARKIVGRELRPDDHAELIRQSLERLPSNN